MTKKRDTKYRWITKFFEKNPVSIGTFGSDTTTDFSSHSTEVPLLEKQEDASVASKIEPVKTPDIDTPLEKQFRLLTNLTDRIENISSRVNSINDSRVINNYTNSNTQNTRNSPSSRSDSSTNNTYNSATDIIKPMQFFLEVPTEPKEELSYVSNQSSFPTIETDNRREYSENTSLVNNNKNESLMNSYDMFSSQYRYSDSNRTDASRLVLGDSINNVSSSYLNRDDSINNVSSSYLNRDDSINNVSSSYLNRDDSINNVSSSYLDQNSLSNINNSDGHSNTFFESSSNTDSLLHNQYNDTSNFNEGSQNSQSQFNTDYLTNSDVSYITQEDFSKLISNDNHDYNQSDNQFTNSYELGNFMKSVLVQNVSDASSGDNLYSSFIGGNNSLNERFSLVQEGNNRELVSNIVTNNSSHSNNTDDHEEYTFFAKGGYVDSATKAIVGEAGPEIITPLDKVPQILAEANTIEKANTNLSSLAGNQVASNQSAKTDMMITQQSQNQTPAQAPPIVVSDNSQSGGEGGGGGSVDGGSRLSDDLMSLHALPAWRRNLG